MRAIVEGLVEWGRAHLLMGVPGRVEVVVSCAVTIAGFVALVYALLGPGVVTLWGVVALAGLLAGGVYLQTVALRLAHHQIMSQLH